MMPLPAPSKPGSPGSGRSLGINSSSDSRAYGEYLEFYLRSIFFLPSFPAEIVLDAASMRGGGW